MKFEVEIPDKQIKYLQKINPTIDIKMALKDFLPTIINIAIPFFMMQKAGVPINPYSLKKILDAETDKIRRRAKKNAGSNADS